MADQIITTGRRFYEDHAERNLPTPAEVPGPKGKVSFQLDDPATPELLSDAEHYGCGGVDASMVDIGLISSAQATAKAIRKAMSPAPAS